MKLYIIVGLILLIRWTEGLPYNPLTRVAPRPFVRRTDYLIPSYEEDLFEDALNEVLDETSHEPGLNKETERLIEDIKEEKKNAELNKEVESLIAEAEKEVKVDEPKSVEEVEPKHVRTTEPKSVESFASNNVRATEVKNQRTTAEELASQIEKNAEEQIDRVTSALAETSKLFGSLIGAAVGQQESYHGKSDESPANKYEVEEAPVQSEETPSNSDSPVDGEYHTTEDHSFISRLENPAFHPEDGTNEERYENDVNEELESSERQAVPIAATDLADIIGKIAGTEAAKKILAVLKGERELTDEDIYKEGGEKVQAKLSEKEADLKKIIEQVQGENNKERGSAHIAAVEKEAKDKKEAEGLEISAYERRVAKSSGKKDGKPTLTPGKELHNVDREEFLKSRGPRFRLDDEAITGIVLKQLLDDVLVAYKKIGGSKTVQKMIIRAGNIIKKDNTFQGDQLPIDDLNQLQESLNIMEELDEDDKKAISNITFVIRNAASNVFAHVRMAHIEQQWDKHTKQQNLRRDQLNKKNSPKKETQQNKKTQDEKTSESFEVEESSEQEKPQSKSEKVEKPEIPEKKVKVNLFERIRENRRRQAEEFRDPESGSGINRLLQRSQGKSTAELLGEGILEAGGANGLLFGKGKGSGIGALFGENNIPGFGALLGGENAVPGFGALLGGENNIGALFGGKSGGILKRLVEQQRELRSKISKNPQSDRKKVKVEESDSSSIDSSDSEMKKRKDRNRSDESDSSTESESTSESTSTGDNVRRSRDRNNKSSDSDEKSTREEQKESRRQRKREEKRMKEEEKKKREEEKEQSRKQVSNKTQKSDDKKEPTGTDLRALQIIKRAGLAELFGGATGSRIGGKEDLRAALRRALTTLENRAGKKSRGKSPVQNDDETKSDGSSESDIRNETEPKAEPEPQTKTVKTAGDLSPVPEPENADENTNSPQIQENISTSINIKKTKNSKTIVNKSDDKKKSILTEKELSLVKRLKRKFQGFLG